MKLNSKVINVTLTEGECCLIQNLLRRCIEFTCESYSDSDHLESVHFIKKNLSDSEMETLDDFINKVL